MKVKEILNPIFGKAFTRFSQALHRYSHLFSPFTGNPDFYFLHVVGGEEYNILKEGILDPRRTIIFQHCILTTSIDLWDWVSIWREAPLVLSHSPIPGSFEGINFFRTPLGAEPSLFYPSGEKEYKAFMTGHVAETECLDSIAEAARRVGVTVYHTGEDFGWDSRFYRYLPYMPDDVYSAFLRKVEYVFGLRKIEGFEVHCIEGAMSGCVPVVPQEPSYDFYDGFALFVQTNASDEEIVRQIAEILESRHALSDDQIQYVRSRFSWEKVVKDIEKAILSI